MKLEMEYDSMKKERKISVVIPEKDLEVMNISPLQAECLKQHNSGDKLSDALNAMAIIAEGVENVQNPDIKPIWSAGVDSSGRKGNLEY